MAFVRKLQNFRTPLAAAAVALLLVPAVRGEAKRGLICVLDRGALGDGKVDDTAALQAALDESGSQGGGIVEVPAGNYRIAGTLSIPANVTLRGTFTSAPSASGELFANGRRLGSTLFAYAGRGQPDGVPFIQLAGMNATIEGFVITYPEWSKADVPPVPYPPTVSVGRNSRVSIDNVAIQNCMFLNSYDAIRLIGAGRHLIRNVTGYPSHSGIYMDWIGDIGRIENVHFWPFGTAYSVNDPYSQWINKNGVAFELAFTDWQALVDCFSFGYGVGYKFIASPNSHHPSCGKMIGCGADSCGLPLDFEAAYSHWEISDGEFVGRWGSKDTSAVEIGPGVQDRISFTNCAFWGPIARVVTMRAPKGIVSLDSCEIQTWSDTAGAIDIEAGRAILTGNSFDRPGKRHLVVGKGAGTVIATGNLAEPFFDVQAAPGTTVIQSANETAPQQTGTSGR
jgi:hypothetical protein